MPINRYSTMLSTTLCVLAFATTSFAAPQAGVKPSGATPKPTKARPAANPTAANTPEAALRRFLVALITRDAKGLRASMVPVSDADFAYLVNGEAQPGEDRLRAEFAAMPIVTLKPGDMVALPGRREAAFPANGLGPDRALLQPEHFPLPFLVQRIGGVWRVNAAPLIGLRKSEIEMTAGPKPGSAAK